MRPALAMSAAIVAERGPSGEHVVTEYDSCRLRRACNGRSRFQHERVHLPGCQGSILWWETAVLPKSPPTFSNVLR
jgi:hypothetical protein